MVGAGPCFILVFTHHRHLTNLFRKNRYLNRNQESSRLLAKSDNIVLSSLCHLVKRVEFGRQPQHTLSLALELSPD